MRYIIIGCGTAGSSAAEQIRKNDPEGEINIFTKENYPLYYRPGLTEIIAGNASADKIILKKQEWYETKNINLHKDIFIKRVDPVKKLIFSENESYSFDKLLLACGAECRIPPIPNCEAAADKIYTLRELNDANNILNAVKNKENVLIMGGGLLGIETAYGLAQKGCKTLICEYSKCLLSRQLSEDASRILQNLISEKGIQIKTGSGLSKIERNGDKLTITLTDGDSFDAKIIIVSAGINPRKFLAEQAGLKTNRGIIVDSCMRTSIEDVYAAGDAAEYSGEIQGLWTIASEQGKIAGNNMSGIAKKYVPVVASHKLKTAGIELVSIGGASESCDSQTIYKTNTKTFLKAFIKEGIIQGACMIGETDKYREIEKAIKNKMSFNSVKDVFTLK